MYKFLGLNKYLTLIFKRICVHTQVQKIIVPNKGGFDVKPTPLILMHILDVFSNCIRIPDSLWLRKWEAGSLYCIKKNDSVNKLNRNL
jgi:hypothetical protein